MNSPPPRWRIDLPPFNEEFGGIVRAHPCWGRTPQRICDVSESSATYSDKSFDIKNESQPSFSEVDNQRQGFSTAAEHFVINSFPLEGICNDPDNLSSYSDFLRAELRRNYGDNLSSTTLAKLFLKRDKTLPVYNFHGFSPSHISQCASPHSGKEVYEDQKTRHNRAEKVRRRMHNRYRHAKDSTSSDFVMKISDDYLRFIKNGSSLDHSDVAGCLSKNRKAERRPRNVEYRVNKPPGKYQVHLRGIFDALLGRLAVLSLRSDLENAVREAEQSKQECTRNVEIIKQLYKRIAVLEESFGVQCYPQSHHSL